MKWEKIIIHKNARFFFPFCLKADGKDLNFFSSDDVIENIFIQCFSKKKINIISSIMQIFFSYISEMTNSHPGFKYYVKKQDSAVSVQYTVPFKSFKF